MSEAEKATLAEMHRRGDSAEVICIVRLALEPRRQERGNHARPRLVRVPAATGSRP